MTGTASDDARVVPDVSTYADTINGLGYRMRHVATGMSLDPTFVRINDDCLGVTFKFSGALNEIFLMDF